MRAECVELAINLSQLICRADVFLALYIGRLFLVALLMRITYMRSKIYEAITNYNVVMTSIKSITSRVASNSF